MTAPSAPAPRRLPLLLALAALAAGCPSSDGGPKGSLLHVPSPAWEDQVVYFVLTDRFDNGDPSNDDQGAGEFDPSNNDRYSGGDLAGVRRRLDYIQGLGATTVWITPPVANVWWDPLAGSAGYHGYWARDLSKVDEHLGTLEDYRGLSQDLHARGMYLIQDVVPNHMGNFFTFSAPPAGACSEDRYDPALFVLNTGSLPTDRPTQAPFDQVDATDPAQRAAAIYHWTPPISDYSDVCQEVHYQISDLDDLNSENPAVRAALRGAYAAWIREAGVDGFRVDTVKYVPHDFWNDFFHSTDAAAPGILEAARATGREDFFAFGEVFEPALELDDAADVKVTSYLGTPGAPGLPAVLQFPLYEELKRVFAGGKPTSDLTYRLARFMDPALYPRPERTPTFIDNHDVQRFLSLGTPEGLTQALALVFTVPGIPIVYQGTEQAFTTTRASMFAGGFGATEDQFDTGAPFYRRIAKLAALRRSSRAFTRGALEVLYDNPAGPGPFVYRRTFQGESAYVFMNTSDEQVLLSGLETGLAAGTQLEILFAENAGTVPAAPKVGAGGRVQGTLFPHAVMVVRPTATVTPPPPPAATITVATALEGQTFTGDVTITGTVAPASARLALVLDGYPERAAPITVAADGSWSTVLPVSLFPTGTARHSLIVYAPDLKVASPRYAFTTEVAFAGEVYAVEDPLDDDHGPAGTYTYPTEATFGRQMDLTSVVAEVGATTLTLRIQTRDFSTVWRPTYGFDHVAFNVYFSLPGQPGLTVLPSAPGAVKLNASTPEGFTWNLAHFGFGWTNAVYATNPGTPDEYGPALPAPTVRASPGTKTVSFTYDRTAYGLASWSGVKIWVATWDFDGINSYFRRITPAGDLYVFGGGSTGCDATDCLDPKIMDDAQVIAIP